MTKKNDRIGKIKELLRVAMPKALSDKILEFNKEFQAINTFSEEQIKEQEKEKALFKTLTTAKPAAAEETVHEDAKAAATVEAKAAAPAEGKTEASAWNAKAYHWEEKAISGWAADRFRQLLVGVVFDLDGGKVRLTEVKSLTGDVSEQTKRME